MTRKMVIKFRDGTEPTLEETPADNEAQLQQVLKEHPEIIPVDDFGYQPPLLIVGEETQLASGASDLLGITSNGALLVIEFKTGPQNSDFRSALAQLIDYGANLWGKTYEEFENAAAVRYFDSDRCREPRFKGLKSLEAAGRIAWPEMTPEDWIETAKTISLNLAKGSFDYVLAAQRLTEISVASIDYLNAVSAGPRFYGVEVVRFKGTDLEAFECRTITKPRIVGPRPPREMINLDHLLETIADEGHYDLIKTFIDRCTGLGLRLEWGASGVSFRLKTIHRNEPVTLAWLFPPGVSGWMGLTNLCLGYDPGTLKLVPGVQSVFDQYIECVQKIPGAKRAKSDYLEVWSFSFDTLATSITEIFDAIDQCVAEAGESGQLVDNKGMHRPM